MQTGVELVELERVIWIEYSVPCCSKVCSIQSTYVNELLIRNVSTAGSVFFLCSCLQHISYLDPHPVYRYARHNCCKLPIDLALGGQKMTRILCDHSVSLSCDFFWRDWSARIFVLRQVIGQQQISHSKLQVKLCLDVFMHDDVVTLQILLHTLPDVVWGFLSSEKMGYVHDPKALPAFCNLHFTDWIIISQFRNLLCFADFNNGELCLKLAYHYTNICCFVALTIDTLRPISWRLLFSHNNFQFVYCWCIIIRQVSECDCYVVFYTVCNHHDMGANCPPSQMLSRFQWSNSGMCKRI